MLSLAGCSSSSSDFVDTSHNASQTSFEWNLPERYPLPVEPIANQMSEEKFQLGRHLFYDTRLSGNGTQACASCHIQEHGFSDGIALPTGSTGELLARNSQGLMNVAYNATQTWANSALITLEEQALVPLFGENPIEHGIDDSNKEEVLDRIRNEARYQSLFNDAYPELGDPIAFNTIRDAIVSFVRGMVSFNSAFDRFEQGDATALSAAAHRGRQLFFSEELECFHCHGGYHLSDSTMDRSMSFVNRPFHNTGLFNIGGTGDYPHDNTGLFEITADPSDMGKFRSPSLRNVALTAPYLHDGSAATLGEVLEIYAAGGRLITTGPHAGDGRLNPFKSSFVTGFNMSEQDKNDVIAFLQSLTDNSFVSDPRFSNPWN
ncbi:MAG: di-heme enzyme [Oleiphilaceae bacterium]|nr:di-heme enzyme [Oleiphilaceae bacterium]